MSYNYLCTCCNDITILMWANPLRGQLEGVCPENPDFFGP